MSKARVSSLTLCVCLLCHLVACDDSVKEPTVFVAILARNKAHTLPYFLTMLEKQNYPKDRMSLWIRSDHNIDNTSEILSAWIRSVEGLYHSVEHQVEPGQGGGYEDELGPAHWPASRFSRVISLREQALERARRLWADYMLQVDCDVLLTHGEALRDLVHRGLAVAAPMLRSDGLYSNFWSGMTAEMYYRRTEEYKPVLNRERVGCFAVPMVHSCVLVDLRRRGSDRLTYDPGRVPEYDGPLDDIIAFARSANRSNTDLHVCNTLPYGYIPVPLEQEDPLERDLQQLVNVRLEALGEGAPESALQPAPSLAGFVSRAPRDTLGFDAVYMINLRRRPERRSRMDACFKELGLKVEVVDAVDGKALNASILSGIHMMPEYSDPYHGRPMTLGEIGCFLSHHGVWQRAASLQHGRTLVLEDDIRFEPFFRARVRRLLEDLERLGEWDLVYLGRKRLQEQHEPWVEGSRTLVRAGYSYWTLGYALSAAGARKLLAARPLDHLLPVDEYLPILFDRHPRAAWKGHFPRRDLVALSASPLLLFPTHYTGDRGYVSDTEDSATVPSLHQHGDL